MDEQPGRVPAEVPEPRERSAPPGPSTTVDVGAVVWGFAFLAVAAVVGVRAATGVTWSWGWNVAGVLLLGGLATVVAALSAAGRARSRRPR
ncbi:hypothetical protein [Kineococcus esterisolvens]|uniref:hypothetical protein n=1 Tax=unclassified Kineococcus TaxID=2621656 RepID=UPI003D7D8B45